MFGGFKFYGSPKETLVSILAKPFDFPLNTTATELSFEQWLDLYHAFTLVNDTSITRRMFGKHGEYP